MESDPVGITGGLDTYVYVESNPLSYIDPLGLFIVGEWENHPTVTDVTASMPQFRGYDFGDPSFFPPGIRTYYLYVNVVGTIKYRIKCTECPESQYACLSEAPTIWYIDGNDGVSTEVRVPVRISLGPWWAKLARVTMKAKEIGQREFLDIIYTLYQDPTLICLFNGPLR